ncbi:glucan 1,4-alpha-glucosidase [Methylocystis sp. L43]|jgi:glucoamylase|uniref:glucan 1,4-alpha-glucosidase n=1 Tax=Methylocystis rosea TaxID=173366 RepID=A0ABX6ELZ0_9HYPH|nr:MULTISPECIES: glycoside hydrolase family 15 protein [Methylocystis]MBG0797064.1 glucan 1,4-alpha-glucosidase [Methylocystis sp. L43]MBG0804910.1 glucan 1,4-alpha-glucosidase [Methylocystis sp. H15]QGM95801.1 glucan 1,4-alpha-glucosidase [Methylocystis rosea]
MSDNAGTLLEWMERQYLLSAAAMLRAVSATELVKVRCHFGQTIRPAPGSVLASPEFASYDPNPDYFFHWVRDSAIVIDALRVLLAEQTLGSDATRYLVDFVNFSLGLCQLDGRAFLRRGDYRQAIDPAYLPHARSDRDLSQVYGDRVLGEARYNADGTLDILNWARPQNDGPALRALAVLRFFLLDAFRDRIDQASVTTLLQFDLDYTLQHWREPCFDLWEEVAGHHYHTRLVQYAALADGSAWMEAAGDVTRAQAYRAAAQEIRQRLDAHFDPDEGVYVCRFANAANRQNAEPGRLLDMAVPLGVIHAARAEGPHSVLDPKALATLARLEQLFAKEYRINQERASDCAPAMGRYAGDSYYSGGAYYFSTLGAAQFYFRFAEAIGRGAMIPVSQQNRTILAYMLAMPPVALAAASVEPPFRERLFEAFLDRGDMFMAMVRTHTPASGELSEQFDQTTGAQTSATNLAWSYAAFVAAFASRRAARRLMAC